MTRGYITIATGDKHYLKIAANLLQSYRFHTKKRMPFAIIAEEENEYTAQFDDVVLTNESTHSFMDKFLLLKLCPYDETIFFDADSLAYGDLNEYWEIFENATDFSAIGVTVGLHDKGAWYNVEDIWKFGDKISYKCRVHMGVCFVRKSDSLSKLYADCLEIYDNYEKLKWLECPYNYDEGTFGIAMPMNNMKTCSERPHMMACLPCLTSIRADIIHGNLSYKTTWGFDVRNNGILVHFGTKSTFAPLYRYEVERLLNNEVLLSGRVSFLKKIQYQYKLRMLELSIPYYMKQYIHWAISKIKKVPQQCTAL